MKVYNTWAIDHATISEASKVYSYTSFEDYKKWVVATVTLDPSLPIGIALYIDDNEYLQIPVKEAFTKAKQKKNRYS